MPIPRNVAVFILLAVCVSKQISGEDTVKEIPSLPNRIAQLPVKTKGDNSFLHNTDLEQNDGVPPGSNAKSQSNNVLSKTLETMLHNPQVMALLSSSMAGKNGNSLQGILNTVSRSTEEQSISFQTILQLLEFIFIKIQYFLSEEARESTDRCIADVSAYVQSLKDFQMWALQLLDASGKPGKSILQGAIRFLGNYDECLDISHTVTNSSTGSSHVINGGYCSFNFKVPPSLLNFTDGGDPLPIGALHSTIQWDLCLPSSCNNSQVTAAAAMIPLNGTGITFVSAGFSEVSDWKQDPGAIVTVAVICFVVFLTIIGTLYEIISAELERCRRKSNDEGSDDESDYGVNNTEVLVTDEIKIEPTSNGRHPRFDNVNLTRPNIQEHNKEEGVGRQVLLSFSISKNTEKILNTKTGESNLGCIHGIRVLSMAWVILGHSVSWAGLTTYENVLPYAEWIRKFTMQFIVNVDLAVDTFFLMSGCLVTFLFLRECEKSAQGRPTVRQMIIYYIHRWWRLTPVYMFILMVYTGLVGHLTTGPMVPLRDMLDPDACRENWWKNILYINNLFKGNMCLPASWFLANDMQFYVVAPLALLPLAFGFSWIGYIVMSAFIITQIVSYGYLEWKTGGSYLLLNKQEFMDNVYRVPWCRIGVFAIGMFLGVILQKTKCKLKIRRHLLLIGWQVFLAIGLLTTYSTYDYMGHDKVWDANTRITFNTLYRPGWGLFVSWVILVCCTGNGGVINTILSWSAWIPLGRLTYGAYLIHTALLDYTEFAIRSIRYADMTFVSYHYLGTFVVSYALSYLTCVLVESPCMGLERALLKKLNVKK